MTNTKPIKSRTSIYPSSTTRRILFVLLIATAICLSTIQATVDDHSGSHVHDNHH